MKLFNKNKKGVISFMIAFAFFAIIIVLISAVVAPVLIEMTTKMYGAGEEIIADSQADLSAIQDSDIRDQINESLQSARNAEANNIEVSSAIYRYGWVGLVGILFLGLFLTTRRTVETERLV